MRLARSCPWNIPLRPIPHEDRPPAESPSVTMTTILGWSSPRGATLVARLVSCSRTHHAPRCTIYSRRCAMRADQTPRENILTNPLPEVALGDPFVLRH